MNLGNIRIKFYIYYILIFLLITIPILVNLNWIMEDERPMSHEDVQILGISSSLYAKNLNALNFCKEVFSLKCQYPPLILSLVYLSFKVFGPFDNSALYLNLFFWPVL